jgi:hypothetical protein
MFKFTNQDNYVEIDINYFDDEEEIGKPIDLVVHINFSINGFSGKSNAYILASQMETFAKDIIKLEKYRQGNAYLVHVADEISFEIKSIDNLGHFGIICKVIKYDYLGKDYMPLKASAFMEINPEQLVDFSKEWWVDIFTI